MSVVPPVIFATLSGSLYGVATAPTAHQTIGVNSAGTAWALRTPGWLDTAQTWTGVQRFDANVGIGVSPSYGLDLFTTKGTNFALVLRTGAFQGASEGSISFAPWDDQGRGRFLFFNPNGSTWSMLTTDQGAGVEAVFTDGVALWRRFVTGSFTDRRAIRTSTSTGVTAVDWVTSWADNTHASRKARSAFSIYDTAAREAWRAESDGSRGYLIQSAHATAPADAMLPNNSIAFWINSGNLAVKYKNNSGTVTSGSVTLA